jgi:hypothetical protein
MLGIIRPVHAPEQGGNASGFAALPAAPCGAIRIRFEPGTLRGAAGIAHCTGPIDLDPPASYVQSHLRAPARAAATRGEMTMSSFDDRQKGQEAKFALDSELQFKAEARRNRLLGLWVAEHMGLSEEHAKEYAAEVVAADFAEAGDEDVFRKVFEDLKAKGSSVSEDMIRQKMSELTGVARQQVQTEG